GRPGWHIECSVMSTKYLGDTLDIHGGGADLIFPHHENEIAQAEAYTGKPFVKYWMHNGFITVNSEKMSKSLGNFFVLRDILAQYPHDVVRYYLIATHYRSPLDFDDGKLDEARKALGRLKTTLNLAEEFQQQGRGGSAPSGSGDVLPEFMPRVMEMQDKFIEAMDDDFNSAKALGYLFEMSHLINSFVAGAERDSGEVRDRLGQAVALFVQLGSILGIFMPQAESREHLVDGLLGLVLELRTQARQAKDYQRADSLRDLLSRLEVKVEDKPGGSLFRYETAPAVEELMTYLIVLREDFKLQQEFERADWLRQQLQARGIILEDTREGVRWKDADA
ncbi:MAG: class I tRNA ligase family protein, partial [Firmicutes bacterium]|nr:class I tRNA ligase family protein [Bacillota bacterium]